MMIQANPDLKNLINEEKRDDDSIYKILDSIKSGNYNFYKNRKIIIF